MVLLYPKWIDCTLVRYSDYDFVGCKSYIKNMNSTFHLLGISFVSWHIKKKASVTLSTIEVKYVVVSNYCAQVIWVTSVKTHMYFIS